MKPRHALLAVLLLLPPLGAGAEVGITAPVREFRLPMFNPAGERVWDIRGAQGERRPDSTVLLRDMWLRFFEKTSPDAPPAPVVEVRSPVAVVHEKARLAEGAEEIDIRGPSYRITGSDWRFEGRDNARIITIGRGVTVRFGEELSSILN